MKAEHKQLKQIIKDQITPGSIWMHQEEGRMLFAPLAEASYNLTGERMHSFWLMQASPKEQGMMGEGRTMAYHSKPTSVERSAGCTLSSFLMGSGVASPHSLPEFPPAAPLQHGPICTNQGFNLESPIWLYTDC